MSPRALCFALPVQVQPFDEHLPGLEIDLVVDAKTAFTWYDAK